jgi:hypothetical protein
MLTASEAKPGSPPGDGLCSEAHGGEAVVSFSFKIFLAKNSSLPEAYEMQA